MVYSARQHAFKHAVEFWWSTPLQDQHTVLETIDNWSVLWYFRAKFIDWVSSWFGWGAEKVEKQKKFFLNVVTVQCDTPARAFIRGVHVVYLNIVSFYFVFFGCFRLDLMNILFDLNTQTLSLSSSLNEHYHRCISRTM